MCLLFSSGLAPRYHWYMYMEEVCQNRACAVGDPQKWGEIKDRCKKRVGCFLKNAEKSYLFWGSVIPCLETSKSKTRSLNSTSSENINSNFNMELLTTSSLLYHVSTYATTELLISMHKNFWRHSTSCLNMSIIIHALTPTELAALAPTESSCMRLNKLRLGFSSTGLGSCSCWSYGCGAAWPAEQVKGVAKAFLKEPVL